MAKKITEQREDELLENITLANEAEQVFSSIEAGEEKTISSKEFFENAKQSGFQVD